MTKQKIHTRVSKKGKHFVAGSRKLKPLLRKRNVPSEIIPAPSRQILCPSPFKVERDSNHCGVG